MWHYVEQDVSIVASTRALHTELARVQGVKCRVGVATTQKHDDVLVVVVTDVYREARDAGLRCDVRDDVVDGEVGGGVVYGVNNQDTEQR